MVVFIQPREGFPFGELCSEDSLKRLGPYIKRRNTMSKYSKFEVAMSLVVAILVSSFLLLAISLIIDAVMAVGITTVLSKTGMATRAFLFLSALSISILFSVSAFTFFYDRVVWVVEKALPFDLLDSEDWSTFFQERKRQRERDGRNTRDGRNRDRDRMNA